MVGDDGVLPLDGFDLMPTSVDLDADAWFRELCRVADRDFTSAEREILPDGTDTTRPCS